MFIEDEDPGPVGATRSRIVVGVDGSPISLGALEWAVGEACVRNSILEVVHATFLPQDALELDSLAWLSVRESAILDDAVTRASVLAPGVRVVGRLGDPPAAELLVDASSHAELLVVGSRGLGPFREFTLGSVSLVCARRAHCPLVIIGPRTVQSATVTDTAERQRPGATQP